MEVSVGFQFIIQLSTRLRGYSVKYWISCLWTARDWLGNIAIAIIVFTFLVKILMLPLTVKQFQDDEIKQYHHAGGP